MKKIGKSIAVLALTLVSFQLIGIAFNFDFSKTIFNVFNGPEEIDDEQPPPGPTEAPPKKNIKGFPISEINEDDFEIDFTDYKIVDNDLEIDFTIKNLGDDRTIEFYDIYFADERGDTKIGLVK